MTTVTFHNIALRVDTLTVYFSNSLLVFDFQ